MDNNKNLEYYINNNQCISLPLKNDCAYLRISNFLSEYQTNQEKLKVLKNLGILDYLESLLISLNNRFDAYATLKFLDDNYVKKIDVYYPEEEDDDPEFDSWGEFDCSSLSYYGIDDFLSLTSINAVQNRIITAALNEKANLSDLENDYINIDLLRSLLSGYLKLLQAGFGIKIDGTRISTTLDLNPFIVVKTLPSVGEPNKIYITPNPAKLEEYILYYYDASERRWIELGRMNISKILLDGYLTIDEADKRYAKIGDGGSGGTNITVVRRLLRNYVKKTEVYTPDLYGISDDDDYYYDDDGNIVAGEYVNISIDNYLSTNSKNPVQNKVITNALNSKQDKLTVGSGIKIEDGVISCTFNTSLYEFVDVLPLTDLSSNKIYLVRGTDNKYKQYVWKYNTTKMKYEWDYLGLLDLETDLSQFMKVSEGLTKSDASKTYLTIDMFNLYLAGGDFSSGNTYATTSYVDRKLNELLGTDSINAILALKELLQLDGSLVELSILLASKANLSDVYTTTQANELFLPKGNYITKTEFETFKSTASTANITVDDFLSSTSLNPVLNRTVKSELDKRPTTDILLENYVTKSSLNTILSPYIKSSNFKKINGYSIVGEGEINISFTLDLTLTETSTNAISSAAVYSFVTELLSNTQNTLVAGQGISIDDNVISVTIDNLNPFVMIQSVEDLPNPGVPNKLYLVKDGNTYYLYIYEDGQWQNKGSIDFSVNLADYITREEAASLLELNSLRSWVDETFVKKSDVYTPALTDSLSSSVAEEIIYNSGESGSSSSGSSQSSGHSAGLITNLTYNSNLPDSIRSNVKVGNINQNTSVAELDGLTFSLIFDRMLFREIWTDPAYRHTIELTSLVTVVEIGTEVVLPTAVGTWNEHITPQSEINFSEMLVELPFYDLIVNVSDASDVFIGPQNNRIPYILSNKYNISGVYTYSQPYSYPSGTYEVTSNYGNTQNVQVPEGYGYVEKEIIVGMPWYINGVKQQDLIYDLGYNTLGRGFTFESILLSGSPVIKIPIGLVCTFYEVCADLGLGYMKVDWNVTRETIVINGKSCEYLVLTKPDSYIELVNHKISFLYCNDMIAEPGTDGGTPIGSDGSPMSHVDYSV